MLYGTHIVNPALLLMNTIMHGSIHLNLGNYSTAVHLRSCSILRRQEQTLNPKTIDPEP